jgi:SAM-dependent methyltransferase
MKKRLLNFLICPVCKGGFNLKIFDEKGGEIKDGVLICSCGQFFPVVNFIPRILLGDLRSMLAEQFPDFFSRYKDFLPNEEVVLKITAEAQKKKETSNSFAFEWQKFSKMLKEWKSNFDFYFEPVGNINSLKNKIILEIGCGKGRHTFYAAKIAKEVIAVDFGRAVDVAFLNNENALNVYFVQADIYNLPFRENYFDFIFSIGVLHHLPTPEAGFRKLVNFVKNGGGILIYVYHSFPKKSFNFYLLRFANFFRRFTTKISHSTLYILCYPIAFLSYIIFILPYKIFLKNKKNVNWPLKAYVEYPFGVILNDTFDRFSAPIENRYSREEILEWYKRAGLSNIQILPGSGWRLFGEKEFNAMLK